MTREDDALHSIEEPLSHSQSAIVDGHSTEPSPDSSAVVSEDDGRGRSSSRLGRPKLGSRKSSGTMIVSRDAPTTVVDSDFEDDDVRAMSPRRNSEEVDKLGEDARRDLIAQAQMLQTSLQAIVDRVETVKTEHEKLEGGNKFLQSYVGAAIYFLPQQANPLLPDTSASSCKHPRSPHQRRPRRARIASENKNTASSKHILFSGTCVITQAWRWNIRVVWKETNTLCIVSTRRSKLFYFLSLSLEAGIWSQLRKALGSHKAHARFLFFSLFDMKEATRSLSTNTPRTHSTTHTVFVL